MGKFAKLDTKGFTLIELLIVIAIIAVLAGFVSFNYSTLISQFRVKTTIHQLSSTIQYAQLNAIANQQQIILIPANERAWSSGWKLLSMDHNTGEQTVLRQFINKHNDLKIALSAFPHAEQLQWQVDGLLQQNNGHFTISASGVSQQLIINKAGRVRSK